MAIDQRDQDELEKMMEELGGEDITIGEAMDDSVLITDEDKEDESLDFNEPEEEEDESDDGEEPEDENTESEDEYEDDNGSEPSGDEEDSEQEDGNIEEPDFESIEVNVGGHKISINSKEELMRYVNLGAEQFGKETPKPSKSDTIVKQGKLSDEDLELLAEAKTGSKEAIAKLAQKNGIDILDIEPDMAENYKKTIEYTQPSDADIEADKIINDVPHYEEFQRVTANLPQSFMKAVTANGGDLKTFSAHIRSGLAQKVIPEAIKHSQLNGTSFMDSYIQVGQKMSTEPAPKEKPQRRESEAMKKVRRRANSGKKTNAPKKSGTSGDDIWDMNDDEFQKELDSMGSIA